jgi:hypothetical protein
MKALGRYESIPESGVMAERDGNVLMIFFDFEKKEKTEDDEMEQPDDLYQFTAVHHRGSTDYAEIVSAIINDKYSLDEVQAIIANYTEAMTATDPTDKQKEYIEEYQTFQAYRKHAKEIAGKVIETEGV